MLHEFLLARRDEILSLCAETFSHVSGVHGSSDELERGLPLFFDELVEVLRSDDSVWLESADPVLGSAHRRSAGIRGKESLRLGYTISQVVQGYGAVCQSITRYASEHGGEPITAREFNRLNACLDIAIAEAVTEFSECQREAAARDEVLRLGFLAHELRNSLSAASTAQQLLRRGVVGFDGSTARLMDQALTQMKDLIDRSLSGVRLQGQPIVDRQRCRVVDLVGEVEATAMLEASARSIRILVDVPPTLVVDADRHLVLSAISNLIQNATKYSREGGCVRVRGRSEGGMVHLDIEDECGGLPEGKTEELFRPFLRKGTDSTGFGLGLSIARRAIMLNGGQVCARDLPGKGCVFTVELPQAGEDSGALAAPREEEAPTIG